MLQKERQALLLKIAELQASRARQQEKAGAEVAKLKAEFEVR